MDPKSGEVTSQNSIYSKQIPADFDFCCMRRHQINARRGVPSFMSMQYLRDEEVIAS